MKNTVCTWKEGPVQFCTESCRQCYKKFFKNGSIACIAQMWPTATHRDMPDFPWSVCLCVLGTPVNRAKTEGPIDMPFGQQTCEGPWNHV